MRWKVSGLEEWLLLGLVGVNAAVLFAAKHFPFIDSVNHLARYYLIAEGWKGQLSPTFAVVPMLTPYIGPDVLGAALVWSLGPDATIRVVGLLGLVLPTVALYVLLRRVCDHRRGWALAAALAGFNTFLIVGLVNFLLGVAAAFLWIAVWYEHRRSASWGVRLALALGIGVLYLVHLSAPLVALVIVWSEVLLVWYRASRGREPAEPIVRPTAVTALAASAALVVMGLLPAQAGSAASLVLEESYRTPLGKLKHTLLPWYGLSYSQLAVLASGYAATLVAFLAVHRRTLRFDCFVVGCLVLVVGYLVTPGSNDVRWLFPAYLLVFAAGRCEPLHRRWVLLVPAVAGLLHALVIYQHLRRSDRELAAFDAVLTRLPRGARVLPVICCEGKGFPPGNPYRHFALWHTIRGGGRATGLFSAAPIYDGGPPPPHLAHFQDLGRLPNPGEERMTSGLSAEAWRALLRHFDYVIQAGRDDRLRRMLEARGEQIREIYRERELRLYRVVAGPSTGVAEPR